MNKRIGVTILYFFIIFISCKKGPLTIEELIIPIEKGNYTYIDTNAKEISKTFIVDNFSNIESDYKKFDSLVCSIIVDSSFFYNVNFIKKSKISNLQNLNQFPRDLDRYSYDKDMIVNYIKQKNSSSIMKTPFNSIDSYWKLDCSKMY